MIRCKVFRWLIKHLFSLNRTMVTEFFSVWYTIYTSSIKETKKKKTNCMKIKIYNVFLEQNYGAFTNFFY